MATGSRGEHGNVHTDRCASTACPCYMDAVAIGVQQAGDAAEEMSDLRAALRDAYIFAAVVNRTALDVCRPDGGLAKLAQEKLEAWEVYR